MQNRHAQLLNTPTSNASVVLEKDVFVCSEYERSAAALSIAKTHIAVMQQDRGLTEFAAVINKLSNSVEESLNNLMHKIQSHLDHYFSKAASTSSTSTGVEQHLEIRGFAHCLRALTFIEEGKVAEKCFASTVMEPLIK